MRRLLPAVAVLLLMLAGTSGGGAAKPGEACAVTPFTPAVALIQPDDPTTNPNRYRLTGESAFECDGSRIDGVAVRLEQDLAISFGRRGTELCTSTGQQSRGRGLTEIRLSVHMQDGSREIDFRGRVQSEYMDNPTRDNCPFTADVAATAPNGAKLTMTLIGEVQRATGTMSVQRMAEMNMQF